MDELKLNFTEHRSPGLEKRLIVSTVDVDEVGEFYSDVIDPTRTSEETIRQQTGVCYFIVGGDDTSSSFVLHPTLHQLQVVKELDRENKSRSGHLLNSFCFQKESLLFLTDKTILSIGHFSRLFLTVTGKPQ